MANQHYDADSGAWRVGSMVNSTWCFYRDSPSWVPSAHVRWLTVTFPEWFLKDQLPTSSLCRHLQLHTHGACKLMKEYIHINKIQITIFKKDVDKHALPFGENCNHMARKVIVGWKHMWLSRSIKASDIDYFTREPARVCADLKTEHLFSERGICTDVQKQKGHAEVSWSSFLVPGKI